MLIILFKNPFIKFENAQLISLKTITVSPIRSFPQFGKNLSQFVLFIQCI
jgi:hypothetical protein